MHKLAKLILRANLPHALAGKNVAQNHLNIQCPFCGDADPSMHLGINLDSGQWGCWRNAMHRGNRPHRLVRQLFGWSREQIKREFGINTDLDTEGDFGEAEQLIAMLQMQPDSMTEQPAEVVRNLVRVNMDKFPPLWKWYRQRNSRMVLPFIRYCESRNLTPEAIFRYDLRYAISGRYAQRIILPVFEPRIVTTTTDTRYPQTWTARAVGAIQPKYLTPHQQEANVISRCVWSGRWYDETYQVLVVTEGPFDALRLDWVGTLYGVRAVCVFGSSPTAAQQDVIAWFAKRVKHVVYAFDSDNLVSTLRLAYQQEAWPSGVPRNDFGEMTDRELSTWCSDVLELTGKGVT